MIDLRWIILFRDESGHIFYQRPFGQIGSSWIEAERFESREAAKQAILPWPLYAEVCKIPE